MAARTNNNRATIVEEPLVRSGLAQRDSTFHLGLRGIRILRLSQVIEITGLRKTTIYELQAAGEFPMRVQITPRSVGWIEGEIQAWLTQRVAARRPLFSHPLSRTNPAK